MGYNAINPEAAFFYRGVVNRSGGRRGLRSFQTIKQPAGTDDFVHPFKLPETPDLPFVLVNGYPSDVAIDEGGGGTTFYGSGTVGGGSMITYKTPVFALAANPVSMEAGSTSNVVVTPTWTQNDAGVPNSFAVTLPGETGYSGTVPIPYTFNNVEFRDAVRTVSATIGYAAGAIKQDGLGVNVPGSIAAGNLTRTVDLKGYRRAFWGTRALPLPPPTLSTEIRALTGSAGEAQGSFVVPIPAGAYDLIFAAPAALGNSVSAILGSFTYDGSAFSRTQVMVAGANGYTPVIYNVWLYSAVIPFPEDQSLHVMITT